MKTVYISILVFFFLVEGIAQETKSPVKTTFPVYNFTQLEPLLHPKAGNDTVYLFNFWATYCAPCIKELPYFDRIGKEFAGRKVKVRLISLDFKSQIESGVVPFIKNKGIQSPVIVLNDPDANAWINKVSPSWSGAIPATLVVKGSKQEFYEKVFTYDELKEVVIKSLEK